METEDKNKTSETDTTNMTPAPATITSPGNAASLEEALTSVVEKAAGADEEALVSGYLTRLALALVAFIQEICKSRVDPKAVSKAARFAVTKMAKRKDGLGLPTWEASPARLASLLNVEDVLYPVRVVASICEFGAARAFVTVENGVTTQVETAEVRLADANGNTIPALGVVGPLVRQVREHWLAGVPCEFLGTTLTLSTSLNAKLPDMGLDGGYTDFFFYVHDVRASPSALDRLGATQGLREVAEAELLKLQKQGISPLEAIVDEIVQMLGIRGLTKYPLLRELLEFTTLQAVSTGWVDNAPARLHGIVVSQPGRGKKLLHLAAEAQNPVFRALSGAKISEAGLVGTSKAAKGKGWHSTPGLLALADGGVASIEDAHCIDKNRMTKIANIFDKLMECGILLDSVAGGQNRRSTASLLIDLNRTSDTRDFGVRGAEAPLLRWTAVLSRTDLLVEIPEDPEGVFEVGEEILRSSVVGQGPANDLWKRRMKAVVALLRDRHPTVDLGAVNETMLEHYKKIKAENLGSAGEGLDVASFANRMSISFKKLVMASARARDSSVANEEDVARALRYINLKLDFLRFNLPKPSDPNSGMSTYSFAVQFMGKEVRPAELAEMYKAANGIKPDIDMEKTFRRLVKKLGGKKVAQGLYLLPEK